MTWRAISVSKCSSSIPDNLAAPPHGRDQIHAGFPQRCSDGSREVLQVDPPATPASRSRGLWGDLCVVAKAGDDEQPDRFSPGAPMVSSVGVDSGQQMSEPYLDPTTDFRPTGSPFVR